MSGRKRKANPEDAHPLPKIPKTAHQTKLSSFFKKPDTPQLRSPGKNITNTIDLTLDDDEEISTAKPRKSKEIPQNLTLIIDVSSDEERTPTVWKGKGKLRIESPEPFEEFSEPTGNFSIASGSGNRSSLTEDCESASDSDWEYFQEEDEKISESRPEEQQTFLDAQKLESRNRRNAQRRAQRSQYDNIHQVKRRARRGEKTVELGKAIVSIVHEAAIRRKAIEKAASSSNDPLVTLPALVRAGRRLDYVQQIPDSAEIWQRMPLDVKKMLVEFSTSPLTFQYKKWARRGTLILDEGEQGDPQKAIYYMRVIAFKNKDTLFTAIIKFLRESLGHLHFGLFLLFSLGFSFRCIQEAVTEILIPFGHEELADFLFKTIDHSLLESLNVCAGIDSSSEFTLTYLGYSIAGSAESRLVDDLTELLGGLAGRDAGKVGKQVVRRITRFCLTNGIIPSPYHIPGLDMAASTPFAIRTDEILSQIEAVCISAPGGLCLNSAPGGFISRFCPPNELRSVVEKGVRAGGTFDLGSEIDASLCDQLRGLIDDQLLYQKSVYPDAPLISPIALTAMKQLAADVIRRHAGHVIVLWVNKDIPLEDFNGTASGLFTTKAGNSFARRRHIYSLIHSSLPKVGDMTTKQIAIHFGANIDLWPLTVGKPNITEHCLFLSRFSLTVSPIIYITSSSTVGYIVRERLLQKVWDHPSNTAMKDRFLQGHSPLSGEDLSSICKPMEHLEKKVKYGIFYASNDGYLDDVGDLTIAQIGPASTDLTILIIILDDGCVKYQPIIEKLRSQIQYILYGIVTILCSVVSTKLSKNGGFSRSSEVETRTWLTACRDAAELVILDSGMRAKLNLLKEELRSCQRALGHLAAILPVSVISKAKTQQQTSAYKASEHGVAREVQFKDLVQTFEGRNELLFERVRQQDSDALFKWFMALGPGKAILPALSASGTLISAEHEKKKKSNTQVLNNFWTNQRLENEKNKKLRGLDATKLAQKHIVEQGDAPRDLQLIVMKLSNNINIRQNFGRFSANSTRRDVYRAGHCDNCDELVVGLDQNSAHHCPVKGEKLFLTNANFRMLERILYPHHILNNPALQDLLSKTPQECGLISLSVRDTLKFLRRFITDFDNIPEDLFVYIRPTDSDLRWHRASALDAALPFLITHGFTGQTAEFVDSAVWHDFHLPLSNGRALAYKEGQWSRMRCSCGYVGTQKTERRKCTKSFVYKHKRHCTQKDQDPIMENAPIRSLFDLSIEHAARIIYYLFVQTDEEADFTVLFT